MKTKSKMNYYIEIMFWILMIIWVSTQKPESFNVSNFNVSSPLWLKIMWITSVWTAIIYILCIKIPMGAKKYRAKYFVASKDSVDDLKLKQYIKKQNKGAAKIAVLWAIFLIAEGISYYLNIIDIKIIILGTIGLRIIDKVFVIGWCPLGVIMGNGCCNQCRIYGWDQLMLNSTLVFLPSIFSYSLILISMIPFIEWEIAIKRHPERFSQSSNAAIRCSNCCEVCGRCRNKNKELWVSRLFLVDKNLFTKISNGVFSIQKNPPWLRDSSYFSRKFAII